MLRRIFIAFAFPTCSAAVQAHNMNSLHSSCLQVSVILRRGFGHYIPRSIWIANSASHHVDRIQNIQPAIQTATEYPHPSLYSPTVSMYFSDLLRYYPRTLRQQKLATRSKDCQLGRRASPSLCMSPPVQSIIFLSSIPSDAILNGS